MPGFGGTAFGGLVTEKWGVIMNTGRTDGTGQQQQPEVPEARVPVIAVFGGARDEDTLKAAEQIGYAIRLSRAILLTGGDDRTGTAMDLKGRVLFGATDPREDVAPAPWIGVVRTQMALDPKPAADGPGLVLTPGGDHLRNYVEAELCDAAIAFEGGDGTSSEVVFCLALGKPLVLVGTSWLSKYPVVPDKREALRTEAQRRVPPRPEHARLGPPIREAYERFDRIVDPRFQHCELPPATPASAVVRAAKDLATKTTSLTDKEREAVWKFRASCKQRDGQ
jgi:predicted Rossmann-fold nucleotide-binding protein